MASSGNIKIVPLTPVQEDSQVALLDKPKRGIPGAIDRKEKIVIVEADKKKFDFDESTITQLLRQVGIDFTPNSLQGLFAKDISAYTQVIQQAKSDDAIHGYSSPSSNQNTLLVKIEEAVKAAENNRIPISYPRIYTLYLELAEKCLVEENDLRTMNEFLEAASNFANHHPLPNKDDPLNKFSPENTELCSRLAQTLFERKNYSYLDDLLEHLVDPSTADAGLRDIMQKRLQERFDLSWDNFDDHITRGDIRYIDGGFMSYLQKLSDEYKNITGSPLLTEDKLEEFKENRHQALVPGIEFLLSSAQKNISIIINPSLTEERFKLYFDGTISTLDIAREYYNQLTEAEQASNASLLTQIETLTTEAYQALYTAYINASKTAVENADYYTLTSSLGIKQNWQKLLESAENLMDEAKIAENTFDNDKQQVYETGLKAKIDQIIHWDMDNVGEIILTSRPFQAGTIATKLKTIEWFLTQMRRSGLSTDDQESIVPVCEKFIIEKLKSHGSLLPPSDLDIKDIQLALKLSGMTADDISALEMDESTETRFESIKSQLEN